jgi:dipeptidyl aminopeptidase/acylaminoacyl peptidase
VSGPNRSAGPARWLGNRSDRRELARQLSPLTWVRPGVSAVITVHGEADASVPYAHAVRLHAALAEAGVSNELVGIAGGGHGYYTSAASRRAMDRVMRFIERQLH